jgi:hypothetical protein
MVMGDKMKMMVIWMPSRTIVGEHQKDERCLR